MIVANDTSLCGAILVLLLELCPGHRAEISYMDRRQSSSRLLSQPGYRAHMKRPLSHARTLVVTINMEEFVDQKLMSKLRSPVLSVKPVCEPLKFKSNLLLTENFFDCCNFGFFDRFFVNLRQSQSKSQQVLMISATKTPAVEHIVNCFDALTKEGRGDQIT